jgi:hypothetical protein
MRLNEIHSIAIPIDKYSIKNSTISNYIPIDKYSIKGSTISNYISDEYGHNIIIDKVEYSQDFLLKAIDTHKKHFPEDFI